MIEKLNPLPDYYPTMYKDYEPWPVLAAGHKKTLATAAKAQQQPAATEDYNIHIISEVKVKK